MENKRIEKSVGHHAWWRALGISRAFGYSEDEDASLVKGQEPMIYPIDPSLAVAPERIHVMDVVPPEFDPSDSNYHIATLKKICTDAGLEQRPDVGDYLGGNTMWCIIGTHPVTKETVVQMRAPRVLDHGRLFLVGRIGGSLRPYTGFEQFTH